MFSANENIALRQHKRRIIAYVEECIPENALDMGTTTMVMQVQCRAPGCVPLETLVCVVFPKSNSELIPNLKESGTGGTYKTKILKPMADVSKQDVLESLPPEFPGGQRSVKKLCIQVRDVMLSQITQIMGDDDVEGRELMAEYLKQCLSDYVANNCVAPEWGEEPSPNNDKEETVETEEKKGEDADNPAPATNNKQSFPSGNFVVRRIMDDDDDAAEDQNGTTKDGGTTSAASPSTVSNGAVAANGLSVNGINKTTESAMDWRRRQDMEQKFAASTQGSIISRLAEREHAPGVRRPGCPCCDPDAVSNYVDSMMML